MYEIIRPRACYPLILLKNMYANTYRIVDASDQHRIVDMAIVLNHKVYASADDAIRDAMKLAIIKSLERVGDNNYIITMQSGLMYAAHRTNKKVPLVDFTDMTLLELDQYFDILNEEEPCEYRDSCLYIFEEE